MIKKNRQAFNKNFSEGKYAKLLDDLANGYPEITFRVAESPIFISPELKEKLVKAGDEIIAIIKQKNFKALTENAIPDTWNIPNENEHPHFLTFDFGLCKNDKGESTPKLIELQGFPSLYGFQSHLASTYKNTYELDEQLTPYFNGLNKTQYFETLKKVLIGKHNPKHVALVDVDATTQKTAIDFWITAKKTGLKVLSWQELIKKDKKLFYKDQNDYVEIKRLYNRLIFDEVADKPEIFKGNFDPRDPVDVEWVTHPNWFYRISKYTMPLLKGEYAPETRYLSDVNNIPSDLENYVLKPLFSFAGLGVIIDVLPKDIEAIKDPENWILQRKVVYEPLIESPSGGVKAEVRLMYLWPDGEEPQLCINLVRLSRGKMIGVRYNADFDWVGGTIGLMQG
jgi:hypothetical protein